MSLNEKQQTPFLEGKELKKADMSRDGIFSTESSTDHSHLASVVAACKVLFLILDTSKTVLAEEMQQEARCSTHTEWPSRVSSGDR